MAECVPALLEWHGKSKTKASSERNIQRLALLVNESGETEKSRDSAICPGSVSIEPGFRAYCYNQLPGSLGQVNGMS